MNSALKKSISTILNSSLKEDKVFTDITTQTLIEDSNLTCELIFKESGILCGTKIVTYLIKKFNDKINIVWKFKEGSFIKKNTRIASIDGPGNKVLAIERVKSAIQADPKESMFFFNLYKIYQEMGKPDRFANEYKNTQQQNPEKWGYGKTLARVIRQRAFGSYSKGDLDNAILGFEDMLKIYQEIGDVNGQVPALFSLGLLNEEKGEVKKAQNYFTQVLAINPNHIQARGKIKSLD